MTPIDTSSSLLPSGMVVLEDWGLIRADGPDAAAFLHGQLTQDIEGLPAGQARWAGYCSAKGRLLATFVVWRGPGAETFYLACSADLLAATLKRLSMFVLRARCKLSRVDGSPLRGLLGHGTVPAMASLTWPPEGVVVDRAEGQVVGLAAVDGIRRALFLADPAQALPPWPEVALAAWNELEVRSGVVRVVAATADQFVPQMVNFEVIGGVNFRKGCYPGQEVVARSQYRGTLKRRTYLFESDEPAQPADAVFSPLDPDQPAGMVATCTPRMADGRGYVHLVECKKDLLDGGLHLVAPDGPRLRPLTLPYTWPIDA